MLHQRQSQLDQTNKARQSPGLHLERKLLSLSRINLKKSHIFQHNLGGQNEKCCNLS